MRRHRPATRHRRPPGVTAVCDRKRVSATTSASSSAPGPGRLPMRRHSNLRCRRRPTRTPRRSRLARPRQRSGQQSRSQTRRRRVPPAQWIQGCGPPWQHSRGAGTRRARSGVRVRALAQRRLTSTTARTQSENPTLGRPGQLLLLRGGPTRSQPQCWARCQHPPCHRIASHLPGRCPPCQAETSRRGQPPLQARSSSGDPTVRAFLSAGCRRRSSPTGTPAPQRPMVPGSRHPSTAMARRRLAS